MSDVDSKAKLV